MSVHVSTGMYIRVCIYMYSALCMYACMHARMHVHMYVCICICLTLYIKFKYMYIYICMCIDKMKHMYATLWRIIQAPVQVPAPAARRMSAKPYGGATLSGGLPHGGSQKVDLRGESAHLLLFFLGWGWPC